MRIFLPFKQGLYCCGIAIALHCTAFQGIANASQQLLANQNTLPANVGLSGLLPEIEQKFKVSFVFKDEDLKFKTVPAKITETENFNEVLQIIETYANLRIEKTGQQVYSLTDALTSPTGLPNLNKEAAKETNGKKAVAPISISGTVLDENGGPIPGVAVLVIGGSATTVTDMNGKFSIEADETATLQFRFVGYETMEVAVAGRSNISVKLKPALLQTKDVVVVGYGTKTKKEVSSAIGSVNAKEISATPVADAAQALQGRVAGLQVVQNSGAPGGTGGTSIRIRGISSVNGSNNPLIVLDGFPLPDQTADNVLNAISPNDIESIDVLKDAAAASIYGVRGSNGVVIINTKRGKEGKSTISFDYYRGIQSAWRLPKMLNAQEYAVINSEARLASGIAVLPKLANPERIASAYGDGTNWLDEIFRAAAMTNMSLSATGGTDKARYAISSGYFKQDGIIRGTTFDRFNFKFNGDYNATKRLKIGNNVTMSRTTERAKNTYDAFNSLLLLAVASPPTVSVRNEDGTYAGGNGAEDGFNEPNPVYDIEVPQGINTKFRAISSIYADYEIIPGLTARINYGLDFVMSNGRSWSPAIPSTGGRPITVTGSSDNTSYNPSYLAEYTVNYKKSYKGHNFGLLGGYTVQDNNYNYLGASRNGYTRLDLRTLSDAAVVPTSISQIGNYNGYGTNRLLSNIGRFSYDYKERYLLSFSLRRDGSSNFAKGNKFAVFPSVSVAWNVMDEPFMAKFPAISNLKVRASTGQTGNQNVTAFAYLQSINTGIQYPFGDNSTSGGGNSAAAPTATKNPALVWEKNQQTNLGIDIGVLKNRVGLSIDIYQRKSLDLLFYVAPPASSGTYDPSPLNTGTMVNKGIDLTLNAVVTNPTSPVKWNATFIFSKYNNKVTDLGLSAPIYSTFSRIGGGGLRVDQGSPVNYFYGFVADGIFQTQEEVNAHAKQTVGTNTSNGTSPGDIRFKDLNGDGIINDKDRTNLGSSIPNFTYGFTNNVSWKFLELSVFLQGSAGNKVLNFTRWYTEGGIANGNFSKDVLKRWTGAGTSNEMPRMIQADPNQNNRVSSRFVEDASYLRVKNIRLSVLMPNKWAKAAKVSTFKLYGSVQNALTFTKYTGFDPEVGGGVDNGFYPQARTFLVGCNLEF